MELDLQSLFGLRVHNCTHWLRPHKSPPPPAFGLIYEGAIGQPRKTTSLCDALVQVEVSFGGSKPGLSSRGSKTGFPSRGPKTGSPWIHQGFLQEEPRQAFLPEDPKEAFLYKNEMLSCIRIPEILSFIKNPRKAFLINKFLRQAILRIRIQTRVCYYQKLKKLQLKKFQNF